MNKNHHVFPLQINNAQCGGSHKPAGTGKGGNLAIFENQMPTRQQSTAPKKTSRLIYQGSPYVKRRKSCILGASESSDRLQFTSKMASDDKKTPVIPQKNGELCLDGFSDAVPDATPRGSSYGRADSMGSATIRKDPTSVELR